MTHLDRDIGTLVRDGVTVFYVTINRKTGETVEAAHPADLPSAEEVERLQRVAEVRADFSGVIEDATHALSVTHWLEFNLVAECGLALVDRSGVYRLGSLLSTDVVTIGPRTVHAERLAAEWNGRLDVGQVAARCAVKVMTRRKALEALIAQARESLGALQ